MVVEVVAEVAKAERTKRHIKSATICIKNTRRSIDEYVWGPRARDGEFATVVGCETQPLYKIESRRRMS